MAHFGTLRVLDGPHPPSRKSPNMLQDRLLSLFPKYAERTISCPLWIWLSPAFCESRRKQTLTDGNPSEPRSLLSLRALPIWHS